MTRKLMMTWSIVSILMFFFLAGAAIAGDTYPAWKAISLMGSLICMALSALSLLAIRVGEDWYKSYEELQEKKRELVKLYETIEKYELVIGKHEAVMMWKQANKQEDDTSRDN